MMMMISGIMQIQYYYYYSSTTTTTTTTTSFQFGRSTTTSLSNGSLSLSAKTRRRSAPAFTTSSSIHKLPSASASASGNNLFWSPDSDKTTPPPPSLSDILWPSLGGFAAMAMLGKIDQMLAPKGMAMTIPPLGAVCAVLFVTPNAPAARKYNMFTAQIGCAALGVLAFTIFGPGWLARSAALAAALAFMIYTKSMHPPAASLPLMFIDGAKLHGLNYWYAFFPGAAGCILLSLIVVSMDLLQHAKANIGDYDDHWKNREQTAKTNAAKAFNTNPHTVANNLNSQVHEVLNNNNNKRRGLGKQHSDDEACLASNPIDRCWRCDKDWDKKREKLADCVLGFGHKTRGGGQKGGRIYQVTDNTDSDLLNPKPGTLRHAVIQDGPLWITFKHGMVIKLQQELLVSSNKTIDGRGGHVHIAGGAGIMLQFVDNVIIHNVHIHDIKTGNGGYIRDSISHYGFRTASDGDGISIFGSTNIWIDHVSMSNCMDGLIDAIEASTAITISNCHFTDHNDVMLFGASDSSTKDEIMQVTLAFNHFGKRLIQRMPRCRFGFFHVVNNDYTHWEMYAIGGSQHPTIISQGNRFIAPPNDFAKEVTKREYAPYSVWKDWLWTSEQDIMMNGAFFNQSGDKSKEFSYTRQDMIKFKPGTYVRRLTRFSGALFCKPDKPC